MTEKQFDNFCLTVAHEIRYYSYAKRRKVGAVIARNGNILSFGFNGTPSGFENNCEEFYCNIKYPDKCHVVPTEHNCEGCESIAYKTKEDVVHAEENAIAKMAKSTTSCEGATMYVTCAPCARCARLIVQSGITRVVYSEAYHSTDGIEILKKANITTDFLLPLFTH